MTRLSKVVPATWTNIFPRNESNSFRAKNWGTNMKIWFNHSRHVGHQEGKYKTSGYLEIQTGEQEVGIS